MKPGKKLPVVFGIIGAVFLIVAPVSAIPAALPGSGDPGIILQMIHPNTKNNSEIATYLDTCGLSTWYEGHKNATYKYVYIVPAGNCSEKLVFLNKNTDERADPSSIQWVRKIGLNEIIDPDPVDPLEGFFMQFPQARNDPAVTAFIRDYHPDRWKEDFTAEKYRQVYLIADGEIFRELVVRIDDGKITASVVDDSRMRVNATEAKKAAGINATQQPETMYLKSQEGDLQWIIVTREGPSFRMISVDTGGYVRSPSGFPADKKNIPGFTVITTGLLVTVLTAARILKEI